MVNPRIRVIDDNEVEIMPFVQVEDPDGNMVWAPDLENRRVYGINKLRNKRKELLARKAFLQDSAKITAEITRIDNKLSYIDQATQLLEA
jgi:hypothetical protein